MALKPAGTSITGGVQGRWIGHLSMNECVEIKWIARSVKISDSTATPATAVSWRCAAWASVPAGLAGSASTWCR
jgi:hypothetical protein